jgi:regulator of replication initiation timing
MIRLTRREKLLAGGLLIFAAAWSLFAVAVNPAFDRIETLNRVISEKQQELEEIRAISKEYIYTNNILDNLYVTVDSQRDTFELLPFLESLIEECGLAQNLETMKRQVLQIDSNYSEIIVEVRLESLSIGRLIDFLSKIESLQARAKTKSLYIKRNILNKNLLDSVIEIYNAELSENEFARM